MPTTLSWMNAKDIAAYKKLNALRIAPQRVGFGGSSAAEGCLLCASLPSPARHSPGHR